MPYHDAAGVPASWWQEQGQVAVVEQPMVRERLWLLPDAIDLPLAARTSPRLIRRRLSRAMPRRTSPLVGVGQRDKEQLEGDGDVAACAAVLPQKGFLRMQTGVSGLSP